MSKSIPKFLRVSAAVATTSTVKDAAGKPTEVTQVTPVTVFGEEHKDKRGRSVRAIDDAERKLRDLEADSFKLTAVTPVDFKVAA